LVLRIQVKPPVTALDKLRTWSAVEKIHFGKKTSEYLGKEPVSVTFLPTTNPRRTAVGLRWTSPVKSLFQELKTLHLLVLHLASTDISFCIFMMYVA
jgi:hypothetical protein